MLRLTSHILLWVALATVLPLLLLAGGATEYGKSVFRQQVDTDMQATLITLQSEFERHRLLREQAIRAVVASPVAQQFLPALAASSSGDIHPQHFERGARLGDFLAGFSNAIPELAGVRILDIEGNGLLRVRLDARADHESEIAVGGWEWYDRKLAPPLIDELQLTPDGEIRYLDFSSVGDDHDPLLLEAVLPLTLHDERIGYLVGALDGHSIDRILDFTRIPHGGQIRLVQTPGYSSASLTPTTLYDGNSNVRVVADHVPDRDPPERDERELWSAEYLPYPNQLRFWEISVAIERKNLDQPFNRIAASVGLFALIALIAILALMRVAAKRIAAPITALSEALTSFADRHAGSTALPDIRGPREIVELNRAYRHMAEKLDTARRERDAVQARMAQQAKLASIGQMAAGIGHELNNPLNNIMALSRLIERDLPEEAQALREDNRSLREEAGRATKIVAGILNFAHQIPIEKQRVPIRSWLTSCVQRCTNAAEQSNVQLSLTEIDSLGAESSASFDPDAIQRVIVNLLTNAIAVTPTGGRIDIRADVDESQFEIGVRDHGPGIDADIRERIFDPFFTTKEVGEGAGLGLSISLGIVEAHGGSLELDNHPGGGAIARLTIPVT